MESGRASKGEDRKAEMGGRPGRVALSKQEKREFYEGKSGHIFAGSVRVIVSQRAMGGGGEDGSDLQHC